MSFQKALIFIMITTTWIIIMFGIVLPIVSNLMDFQPKIDLSSTKNTYTYPTQTVTNEIIKERLVIGNATHYVVIIDENGNKYLKEEK